MKYNVTGDFTLINASGGTVQNLSSVQPIEISNSNAQGSGVLVKPFESISFSGNIYVRCPAGNSAEIRIVPFNAATASSSSSDSTSGGYDDTTQDIWNDATSSYDPDWDSELNRIFNP